MRYRVDRSGSSPEAPNPAWHRILPSINCGRRELEHLPERLGGEFLGPRLGVEVELGDQRVGVDVRALERLAEGFGTGGEHLVDERGEGRGAVAEAVVADHADE